jgi:8-amino-7-oxononanoate synthase
VREDPTPIVPVITGTDDAAMGVARYLDDRGIFALPILSPAVPPRTSRLRITVTAAHTEAEADRIAGGLVAAWHEVAHAAAKR